VFPVDTIPLGGAGNNNISSLVGDLASPQTRRRLARQYQLRDEHDRSVRDMSGLLEIDFRWRIRTRCQAGVRHRAADRGDSLGPRHVHRGSSRPGRQRLQQAFAGGSEIGVGRALVLVICLSSFLGWLKDVMATVARIPTTYSHPG
jgi:hypothetical protein